MLVLVLPKKFFTLRGTGWRVVRKTVGMASGDPADEDLRLQRHREMLAQIEAEKIARRRTEPTEFHNLSCPNSECEANPSKGARFCGQCGHDLREIEKVAPPQPG